MTIPLGLGYKIKDAFRRPLIVNRKFVRGVEGIRTPDEGFADPCLTTWPRRHFKLLSGRWDSNPRPSPWQGDVLPLYYARISGPLLLTESAETQNRTVDTAIFSRVLYQLSYLGQIFSC